MENAIKKILSILLISIFVISVTIVAVNAKNATATGMVVKDKGNGIVVKDKDTGFKLKIKNVDATNGAAIVVTSAGVNIGANSNLNGVVSSDSNLAVTNTGIATGGVATIN